VTEIALFEAMYSARALRRLKPDPVPEQVLTKVLDAAIRAPSAGIAQSWSFVVVRDVQQRAKLGAIYRKASNIASAIYANRERPAHMSDKQYRRLVSSGSYLWDHMGEAPVLLVPCMKHPRLPPCNSLPPEAQAKYTASAE
jgi:nitroreductase